MPLLIISYAAQYLDKTGLSYSAVLGIKEDLVSLSYPQPGDTNKGRIWWDKTIAGPPVSSTLATWLRLILYPLGLSNSLWESI